MATRFCIFPDPVLADGEIDDVSAIFRPDDAELAHTLGRTGIASTPVFSTSLSWDDLLENRFPDDATKTGDRIVAAEGYSVSVEGDPFD